MNVILRADVSDSKEDRKQMLIEGLEAGITGMIVRREDADFSKIGKMDLIVKNGNELTWNNRKGAFVIINDPKDQEKVLKTTGKDFIVISASGWKVIPLENLIAKFRSSGTEIYAVVSNADDAELCSKTLETGTDGVVIDVTDPSEVSKFAGLTKNIPNIGLVPLKVKKVKNIEMGDRVCIDTCSSMEPGEGMLIGSQSSALFLVQSECEDNGYVAARPFRVNAGAVHAYVMMPNGSTRYLSELKSGDPVLIVSRNGSARSSSVGRCKIEKRPMVLLEATDGKNVFSTILQNAETVKVVTPKGSLSVSELKEGDEILAKTEKGGRHFGMAIEETIKEI
jgi:Predicted alternative 3-dehydroquinate synthase